jgi:hypothetical protein
MGEKRAKANNNKERGASGKEGEKQRAEIGWRATGESFVCTGMAMQIKSEEDGSLRKPGTSEL